MKSNSLAFLGGHYVFCNIFYRERVDNPGALTYAQTCPAYAQVLCEPMDGRVNCREPRVTEDIASLCVIMSRFFFVLLIVGIDY